MSTYDGEPLQLLLLPRITKDDLNQIKGNIEGVGGSKKSWKYFLKSLHYPEGTIM